MTYDSKKAKKGMTLKSAYESGYADGYEDATYDFFHEDGSDETPEVARRKWWAIFK